MVTQPTAAFRKINSEYEAQEAERERYTVDLKVFGGAFNIDRVISNLGGIVNEVAFQSQQKVKAAAALFNDTVINGDAGVNDGVAFDGLDKAVTGSSTEIVLDDPIDLSTSAAVTQNYIEFLDVLDEFLMELDGEPSFIGGNLKLIAKIRACARRAGMYQVTKNDFGQQVERYGNIPLVDFEAKAGSNDPVVPIAANGETALYAARLGLDGFHGVSMAGVAPVQVWLPDYTTAGAVKKGEVEMVAAVALKATKAAGILRKIKVQ